MNKKLLDQFIPTGKEILDESSMNVMRILSKNTGQITHEDYINRENREDSAYLSIFMTPDEYYSAYDNDRDGTDDTIDPYVGPEKFLDETSITNYISPQIINTYVKSAKMMDVEYRENREETDVELDEKDHEDVQNVELTDYADRDSIELDSILLPAGEMEEIHRGEDVDNDKISDLLSLGESTGLFLNFKTTKDRKPRPYTVDGKKFYPIYVVLTKNDTWLGGVIRSVTKFNYNHASIGIDPTLNRMYSFGTREDGRGGMVVESLKEGPLHILAFQKDSEYALYTALLEEKKFIRMVEYLDMMVSRKDEFSYKFTQLVKILLNIPDEKNQGAMICSEFVANVLKHGDEKFLRGRYASLIAPHNIITDDFYFVSSGYLKEYNYKHTLRAIQNLTRTKKVYQYLTENYTGAANYEVFKGMYKGIDPKINKLMKKFYPSVLIKPPVLFQVTNGGSFYNTENKTQEDILQNYDSSKNFYKVEIKDQDHIVYCYILHQLFASVFLSGSEKWFQSEDIQNKVETFIINQWEDRVIKLYDKLQKQKLDRNGSKVTRQMLLDLMWDFRDNPHNYIRRNSNRYLFSQWLGNIYFPAPDGFLSKEEYKINFQVLREYDDSPFLTLSAEYPAFNGIDLQMYVDYFPEVETYERPVFMENWIKKYVMYRCDFKIPSNTLFAKCLPKSHKYIIDTEYEELYMSEDQ